MRMAFDDYRFFLWDGGVSDKDGGFLINGSVWMIIIYLRYHPVVLNCFRNCNDCFPRRNNDPRAIIGVGRSGGYSSSSCI